MQTLTLRGTDLTVSRACFGTMTFGAQTDEAAAERMVETCLDRGVNWMAEWNGYRPARISQPMYNLLARVGIRHSSTRWMN
jgi:predicted oxidoreductase